MGKAKFFISFSQVRVKISMIKQVHEHEKMRSWGVLGNAALTAQCCTKICLLNSVWESIKRSISSSPTQPFTFSRKGDRPCMGRRGSHRSWRVEDWNVQMSKMHPSYLWYLRVDYKKLHQTGQLAQSMFLCFVQENGHKKVSREYSSHGQTSARALATWYNHQSGSPLCCKSTSCFHQYANNSTSYVVTLMRHDCVTIQTHPWLPVISKPTLAKYVAQQWLLPDAILQIKKTIGGHSQFVSCWVIKRKNRVWFTIYEQDTGILVAVLSHN